MRLSNTKQPSTFAPPPPLVHDLALRNTLIAETLWLVRSLAGELLQLHGFSIAREDLESCGMRGLIRAAECFDIGRGARFSTYAYYRIRGVMLDAIRDGHGRCTRTEMARMMREADAKGRYRGCRTASAQEGVVAATEPLESLTIYVGNLAHELLQSPANDSEPDASPEDLVDQKMTAARVRAAIRELPARDREVVELLYYRHHGSFEAVARELGVTRPYIFRVHARALARLRDALAVLAP